MRSSAIQIANQFFLILLAVAVLSSGVNLNASKEQSSGALKTPIKPVTDSQTSSNAGATPRNYVTDWTALNGLFNQSHPANSIYVAIGQWDVLNDLFNANTGSKGFYALDPVSRWIILNALFGNSHPNDRINLISQWIVLNGLFNSGTDNKAFNGLDQISQWIILNGLFTHY